MAQLRMRRTPFGRAEGYRPQSGVLGIEGIEEETS
jgi:hypothetical protein